MAQLVTEKEKYGVPVAARIDPVLAHRILERAEALGVSYARMIGMLISKGVEQSESKGQIVDSEEITRTFTDVTAEFIKSIAKSDEEYRGYISIYQEIWNKRKN